jgi:dsDNA-specific endonuclease/ATPase MutS2
MPHGHHLGISGSTAAQTAPVIMTHGHGTTTAQTAPVGMAKVPMWSFEGTVEKPALELRLLGMREAEAVRALERQLDQAAIHGLPQFSVIHGKGNGVLQQAVRRALAESSAVAEYDYATLEDGGAGKTWVKMRG